MCVSRFAKVNVAGFPLHFDSGRSNLFEPQASATERDDYIVIAMNMPQRRVANRDGDVKHAHEFIFKFRMMAWLAAYFDRRVSSSGRILRKSASGSETERK